jgi:hypothetical protein
MTDQTGQDVPQRRLDLLIHSIATGEPITEAARRSGYSERTIRRWLHKPTFSAKVSRIRGRMIAAAAGRMADAMADAAQTLRGLLGAESESVRLAAARSIVELGCRLREAGELEERLTALEEKTNAKPSNPPCTPRNGVGCW